MDSQMVELAGRHWLTSQLMRADLEVALPERDRGIDLIVFADLDEQMGDFVACPIQMKAATGRAFTLEPKYEKFRRLLLVYVWNLDDSANTTAYALTYAEAFGVADAMGFTKTDSWLTGGKAQKRGYGVTRVNPTSRLHEMLQPFRMSADRWRAKVAQAAGVQLLPPKTQRDPPTV
jgi:hypothetical protein